MVLNYIYILKDQKIGQREAVLLFFVFVPFQFHLQNVKYTVVLVGVGFALPGVQGPTVIATSTCSVLSDLREHGGSRAHE